MKDREGGVGASLVITEPAFSRILTCIAALIGGILPLTGYYIWLKRVGKKRRTK